MTEGHCEEIYSLVQEEHHAIYHGFLFLASCEKSQIRLQAGETIDYKWITQQELIAFYETECSPTFRERLKDYVGMLCGISLDKMIAVGGTADIYDIGNGKIFKRFHEDKSDYCIANEIECTISPAAVSLGAPKIYGRINDERGRGIIMEYVAGRSMLEVMLQDGADFDIEENAMELAGIQILEDLPQGKSVCHTDMHPGNVIVTENGYRLIDWCDTMCDSPWLDVARTLLIFESVNQIPGINPADLAYFRGAWKKHYRAAYEQLVGKADRELKDWMAILAAVKIESEDPVNHSWMMRLIEEAVRE